MLIVVFEYEYPLSLIFQREMSTMGTLLKRVPTHLARCQLSVFQEKLVFELMVEQQLSMAYPKNNRVFLVILFFTVPCCQVFLLEGVGGKS